MPAVDDFGYYAFDECDVAYHFALSFILRQISLHLSQLKKLSNISSKLLSFICFMSMSREDIGLPQRVSLIPENSASLVRVVFILLPLITLIWFVSFILLV